MKQRADRIIEYPEAPKGITVVEHYKPDMKRMVQALRIVLESTPPSKTNKPN